MPRKARLDAPGALHHVMTRGIEGRKIFRGKVDYEDFLSRLRVSVLECGIEIYAWALLPNHFHLLVRTRATSLSSAMRKLLTGYVVSFNRRHRRHGYLFQNRYKSLLCEDEPYLLELTRYIHVNPYRPGLVKSLEELDRYSWCGHSVLMGEVDRSWQNVDEILGRFGEGRKRARSGYRRFVREGIDEGRRPEYTGDRVARGGQGWSEVLPVRRRKGEEMSDSRILGSDVFVEGVLREARGRERESVKVTDRRRQFKLLLKEVAKAHGVDITELTSGARRQGVRRARGDLAHAAVKGLGMSGAEVARHLGVTTSCVNRIVSKRESSDTGKRILHRLL